MVREGINKHQKPGMTLRMHGGKKIAAYSLIGLNGVDPVLSLYSQLECLCSYKFLQFQKETEERKGGTDPLKHFR